MSRAIRARFNAAPTEGWISLILVSIMAVTVAWSLDDAALVLGRRDWTDFLAWAALGGVLVGFVGARAGWNRPVAHLIGAAFAALLVPIMVGSVLDPTGSPAARYVATATASFNAFYDFAIRGLPVTRESGHYLLVLGLLCWANGQFAASAVFRHGRPIGPIIVLGAVLVANESATMHDQIWFLVLFTMASLFLLTRLHALEERATWIRRRIGDPTTVGSLYLRGGTIFIVAAIFAALTLTAKAHSAPLAGFWDGARPALVNISQWLQRIIPAALDSRGPGIPSFGAQVTINGQWTQSDIPALEINRAPGDDRPLYWRATTYDTFNLFGWTTEVPSTAPRPAGTAILDGTLDFIPASAARTTETFRIAPLGGWFNVAFSPIDPLTVDQDATLNLAGTDGFFQSIALNNHDPYVITASIPTIADVAGGLTKNRLRAAGKTYPLSVTAQYLDVPAGAMGQAANKLLADLQARVKASGHDTPFDLATAIVDEFHTSRYAYQTNVLGVCDNETSIVECFADHKVGYCEHYASTMAILLRQAKIPARLVEGFLPGTLDPATGKELINSGGAHAWVEVYFPGYGWETFDPTGGGRSNAVALPVGTFVPLPSAAPLASIGPTGSRGDNGNDRERQGTVPRPTPTPTPNSNLPLFVVGGLLLAAVLLVGSLAWRRGPRNATTADAVYASVTGIARRFGFGPRPTQTAFEYATALGDILPGIRPELQTVASAKVEVAYGRRELGDDRVRALRASYRRLRVSLLRLAFRRRDRRRMR